MKHFFKNHNSGFTLIEIMLVIVIIGIITVASISAISQRVDKLKVNKAAIQMQQILEASLYFYIKNGGWPCRANETESDTAPIKKLIDGGYLPKGSNKNPWGGEYLAGPTSEEASLAYCSPPNWLVNTTGSAFFVKMQLPESISEDYAEAIAKRVNAKLPNSSLGEIQGKIAVGAQVPFPGFPSEDPIIIMDIYWVSFPYQAWTKVRYPSCSSDRKPGILATVRKINTAGGHILYGYEIVITPNNDERKWKVEFVANRGTKNTTEATLDIVTYCQKK